MWSLHYISYKWAEPKSSRHAAQGVAEVLYTECYSLHYYHHYLDSNANGINGEYLKYLNIAY